MSDMLTGAEAATPTPGQATSQGAESAQTAGTPAAGEQSTQQQQQATEGQDSKAQDSAGEQGKGEEAAKTGAPEAYEFKAAEGREFDTSVIERFSKVARELDLPQDAAQKILDEMAPALEARQVESLNQALAEWTDASKSDKEFGGQKLDENLGVARKALDQFGSDGLRELLSKSGLGNHPEVIRFMYRAGKAISGDSKLVTGTVAPATNKDDPRSLYPNSNMK